MAESSSENSAPKAAERPAFEIFLSLIGSLTSYIQARFRLVRLEGKEAGARLLVGLIWLLLAIVFAVAGYMLLLVTLVGVLAVFVGIFWPWAVLGLTILHLILAVAGIFLARNTLRKVWFEETLRQLSLDQQWIEEWTQRTRSQTKQP